MGATTLVPLLQIVSGMILALLAIATGVRSAVLLALLASGALILFAAVLGSDVASVAILLATGWLPVLLLVTLWQFTRSAQLTLQLSVIVAVMALFVFEWAIGDSAAYWEPMIEAVERFYQERGVASPFPAQGDEAGEFRATVARTMTSWFVVAFWFAAVMEFLLGGGLYNQLPGERPKFSRFRDVNFGQVIATLLVLVMIVAYLTGSEILYQVGVVVFAAFLLQGFAVAHWLHLEGHSPGWIVVLLYVLLLSVPVYVVIAVAVTGFLDAWFGIRRRLVKNEGLDK
ncbi:MAG: DUF2232 domain-containing protein [Gammaproteobacteria bacterium]|nr:DUF2232 domain-containing protein [Gammaproteobacteria bacterium]